MWHLKDEFGYDVAFIKVPTFGSIERRTVTYLSQDVNPVPLTKDEFYFKYSKDATIRDFLALQDFTHRVALTDPITFPSQQALGQFFIPFDVF